MSKCSAWMAVGPITRVAFGETAHFELTARPAGHSYHHGQISTRSSSLIWQNSDQLVTCFGQLWLNAISKCPMQIF